MARGIWGGSISFGLVNVPVKLYPAVRRKDLRFHQFQAGTTDRVRYKRVSEVTGEELAPQQIARGYELSRGRFVMVSDEELESLKPETTHTIDIEEFVDLRSIDPVFYDTTYYVAPAEPSGGAAKAYALLAQAMRERDKVAIGKVVIRTKQYLAAVRPFEEALALSTMLFADEVLPISSVEDLSRVEHAKPSDRELSMAAQLIDSLASDFDPSKYHDTYREEVLDMIRARADGEPETAVSRPAQRPNVVDIMAALEASLQAVRNQGADAGRTAVAPTAAGSVHENPGAGTLPSREELYEEAKRRGLPGRSKMTREQLAAALESPERKSA